MIKLCHMLPVVALCLPAMVQAQSAPHQDLTALEARVVAALGAPVGQPGGPAAPIDRRLKLARCPSPVEIDAPAIGAVAVRCAPLGWRIRVPLVRGAALASAVAAAPVVRKGDAVELVVDGGGFSVGTEAVALEDGGSGQRIRVRRDPKAPVMIAEVVAAGRVRVASYR